MKRADAFFDGARSTRLHPEEKRRICERLLCFAEENPVRNDASERQTSRMDHVFRSAKDVSLPAKEKDAVRGVLRTFVASHPVRPRRSIWGSIVRPFRLHALPATAMIVVIFFTGSGVTAYAAEGSLPGDPLYCIKVDVMEPLMEQWYQTDEAKAEWDAERMERRMEEAEKLLQSFRLDERVQTEIVNRIQTHADRLNGRLEQLASQQDDPAVAVLVERTESALDIHEDILNALEITAVSSGNVLALRQSIGGVRAGLLKRRAMVDALLQKGDDSVQTNVIGKMVNRTTDSLSDLGDDVRHDVELTGQDVSVAKRRITEIQNLLDNAKRAQTAGSRAEALQLARDAQRQARRMDLTLRARRQLNIVLPLETEDASGAPSVPPATDSSQSQEEIVPRTGSGDAGPERVRRSVLLQEKVNAEIAVGRLRTRLTLTRNAVAGEELKKAEMLLEDAGNALARGQQDDARDFFQQAQNTATDALTVLDLLREHGTASGMMPVPSDIHESSGGLQIDNAAGGTTEDAVESGGAMHFLRDKAEDLRRVRIQIRTRPRAGV